MQIFNYDKRFGIPVIWYTQFTASCPDSHPYVYEQSEKGQKRNMCCDVKLIESSIGIEKDNPSSADPAKCRGSSIECSEPPCSDALGKF